MPKDPRDHPIRSDDRAPDYPRDPRAWAPDDEISLFEIWDALVRRRWLIAAVAAAVTVAAAAYALTRPDIYRYQTTLRIGHMAVETQEGAKRQPVDSPEAVAAQLEAELIPQALRQVLGITEGQAATGGASIPDVRVDSPDGARIVGLRIEGPASNAERYREILRTAAGLLVRDHAGILETERIRLQRRAERLEAQSQRLTQQLEKKQERLERLVNSGDDSAGAVSLRIDTLQQQAGSLEDRMLEIAGERDRIADAIATLDDHANLFTGGINAQAIAQQRAASNHIAAGSNGIRPTTVLSLPKQSLTQTGTSGSLILSLGAILGVMGGVFSGFAAEFVAAARRRRQFEPTAIPNTAPERSPAPAETAEQRTSASA